MSFSDNFIKKPVLTTVCSILIVLVGLIAIPTLLGDLQNNAYPVEAGLKAGDQVAISNTSRLRSGMAVQVKTEAN